MWGMNNSLVAAVQRQSCFIDMNDNILTGGGGSCQWGETVSQLWPLTGVLFILQMIHVSREPWWNDIDRRKLKKLGEKSVPLPLCLSQIPHGLTWAS
jgi:hypothetical protein